MTLNYLTNEDNVDIDAASDITTTTVATTTPKDDCSENAAIPSIYSYAPGIGAYKYYSNQLTWNQARQYCENEGGKNITYFSFQYLILFIV